MKKPLLLLRLCGALAICATYAACSAGRCITGQQGNALAPVAR